MPEPRVRVFVKRRLRLDLLNYDQQQMFKLGVVGLSDVLDRIGKSKNTEDQPAKPLKRGYAIRKTKRGLGNRRNLKFTGAMLQNLSVRTVSRNFARAGMTTLKQRQKALANSRIEEFASFSPRNQQRVADAANQIMNRDKIPFLIIERAFNV
jgi:hypothetical protein